MLRNGWTYLNGLEYTEMFAMYQVYFLFFFHFTLFLNQSFLFLLAEFLLRIFSLFLTSFKNCRKREKIFTKRQIKVYQRFLFFYIPQRKLSVGISFGDLAGYSVMLISAVQLPPNFNFWSVCMNLICILVVFSPILSCI